MKAQTLQGRTHWIFDLDGTLTRPQHDFDAIRTTLGIPPGYPILEYLQALPECEADPLYAELDRIEDELAQTVQPQPGCVNLVDLLAARERRLGILTRNSRANALRSLALLGVRDAFEPACVLGRSEAAAKPNPEGILKLLQHWRCSPDDAVMVGDFRFDLEAGRAAGVLTVHLDVSGVFPWPAITDLGVHSLEALVDHLS